MAFERIIAKAGRLIAEGRVQELPRPRVYSVHGDNDHYIVALGDGGAIRACTCPATGDCSHIAAALRSALEGDDESTGLHHVGWPNEAAA